MGQGGERFITNDGKDWIDDESFEVPRNEIEQGQEINREIIHSN